MSALPWIDEDDQATEVDTLEVIDSDVDAEGAWAAEDAAYQEPAALDRLPLTRAVLDNDYDTAAKLLAAGADVHANNEEALLEATEDGRVDIARLLLDRGADLHFGDDAALVIAARRGHIALARTLVKRGAVVTPTAMQHAVRSGSLEMVRLFVHDGRFDLTGDFEALLAAVEGNRIMIAEYLLLRGAQADANDDEALIGAAWRNNTEMVRLLLSYHAHADARESAALVYAARNGNDAMVELLLSYGADIDAQNSAPLQSAINLGRTATARFLLSLGAAPLVSVSIDRRRTPRPLPSSVRRAV